MSLDARPAKRFARVDGLTKRYGRLTALADVSLTIRRGEVLGLIGPNGAGKTTLFECMAGLLPADCGHVSVGGDLVSVAQRGRHMFYLPDAIAPWPSQTVGWALEFIRGFFGTPSPDTRGHAPEDIIRQLGLVSLLQSRIGTLSKGQRKRVLLAVGLLAPQPLLLADEPFDGLDLRQTREVAAALRAHATAGRTLFLSIHQISDAARVCDRFVLLSGGRVCGEGTFDDLAHAARREGVPPPADLEEIVLALT